MGALDVAGLQTLYLQSDAAQMQTVGILAEVVRGIPGPTWCLELCGIQFAVAVSEVEFLVRLLHAQPVRMVEAVPAPFALRSQGDTVLIVFRKSLQSCDVGGKGKRAIAHAQRCQRVDTCNHGVVPRHQRLAVNSGMGRHHAPRQEYQKSS